MRNVLPCKYCRENYTKTLDEHPLTDFDLANRENFSRWVYKLHNIINCNTNKSNYKTYD